METLPGYDAWKLSGPPEPSEYVRCARCGYDDRRDDSLHVERPEQWLCAKCATCGCGAPAVRLCQWCAAATCAACYREYDYGVDPETGVRDCGERCGQCGKVDYSANEPPPSADGGGECPW